MKVKVELSEKWYQSKSGVTIRMKIKTEIKEKEGETEFQAR